MADINTNYIMNFLVNMRGGQAVVKGFEDTKKRMVETAKQAGATATEIDRLSKSLDRLNQKAYKTAVTDLGKTTKGAISPAMASQQLNALYEANIAKGLSGQQMGVATGAFGGIDIGKLAMRAAVTIPIWFAVRASMKAMFDVVSTGIKTFVEFEDSMAEIKTMLTGTPAEISKQMYVASTQIKNLASQSRVSLGEVAAAFRYLKSANLDFQETTAAFPVVVRLMNTFGLSAQEASRAIAGMYNTAKDKFPELTSNVEKFNKIGDVLAYTYVKQDVLVGELIASYSKLAPYIQDTNVDFTSLMTTMGYLNTLMLRSGRTGTSFGRMLQEMAQNAGKLQDVFNIKVDKSKAIDFLDILTAISNQLTRKGAFSAEQMAALFEVFEVRAGIPVKLLVNNLQELKEAIRDAKQYSHGYLEELEKIKMETTAAQIARLSNNFKLLTSEFAAAYLGANQWSKALKQMADAIDTVDKRNDALVNSPRRAMLGLGMMVGMPIIGTVVNDIFRNIQERTDARNKDRRSDIEPPEQALKRMMGDIANAQERQLNLREKMKVVAEHQVQLAKIEGKTELEILFLKKEQLEAGRSGIEADKIEIENLKNILEMQRELTHLKKTEKETMGGFAFQYELAPGEDKQRLRDIMEMRTKSPEELLKLFQDNSAWKELILKNRSQLTSKQLSPIEDYLLDTRNLKGKTFTTEEAQIAEAITLKETSDNQVNALINNTGALEFLTQSLQGMYMSFPGAFNKRGIEENPLTIEEISISINPKIEWAKSNKQRSKELAQDIITDGDLVNKLADAIEQSLENDRRK